MSLSMTPSETKILMRVLQQIQANTERIAKAAEALVVLCSKRWAVLPGDSTQRK